MITREESQALIERVLKIARSDETEVSLSSESTSHVRFARNSPSTSGHSSDTVVTVQSTFGTRTAAARTNQLDDSSIASVVRKSEELARLAPEDPEFMPALGPQKYGETRGWNETTAGTDSQQYLATGAKQCIETAEQRGLVTAGFLRLDKSASALGNSAGLFAYDRSTVFSISQTVRTASGDGSGWVSRAANDISRIDFGSLATIACDKAESSAKPKRLEPGTYVTILEPSCVADLMRSLLFSMEARNADEGRSYFSAKGGGTKIGERLFDKNVTIYSDPSDTGVPGSPWGEDGLPQRRIDWIENGTLRNLRRSRFWANKQGLDPIPFPSNIIMKGGKGSINDLIRSTERGILVTSLWYIRSVDPQTLLLTGLTRDGVFLIENGAISHPVMNFRWNESPAAVLQNIESMSESLRVPPRESAYANIMIPALKVGQFHFTSISEAV